MGRRKIEIRPIKDDRNRSVTFLKRKGGLFKKAYELSRLCACDVSVIVFNGKKLYEFSSGDINETIGRFQYFAGAHEHKGPADFAGKAGDDDDDEEVDGGSPPSTFTPPDGGHSAHGLQHQPNMQHVAHAPSAESPPIPNGTLGMHARASPQPGNMPRPGSRAAIPQRLPNLAPPHFTPPPPAQMGQQGYGFAHVNQQYYQHPNGPHAAGQPSPPFPSPGHAQLQQAYMQDQQRRQSLPPGFQHSPQMQPPHMQPPHASPQLHLQPPAPQPQPLSRKQSPQSSEYMSPPDLPSGKPYSAQSKSHSIFTPIEDSRSLLAQHWGAPPSNIDPHLNDHLRVENVRSQSIDVGAISHDRANGYSPIPPPSARSVGGGYPAPPTPQRANSSSSVTSAAPLTRSNTMQSDARRPRLKVQIPAEASDTELSASAKDTVTSAHPPASSSKGVVLPPPSPSANALLSAGATGPPNPFARPAPPVNPKELETPLSALPSRVMEGNMLPSPSDLWGNMFSSRSNNDNMMPSPLNFQPTPITTTTGASFKDEPDERKRRADLELSGAEKRIKT